MMSANKSGDVLLVEPDWMDESLLSRGWGLAPCKSQIAEILPADPGCWATACVCIHVRFLCVRLALQPMPRWHPHLLPVQGLPGAARLLTHTRSPTPHWWSDSQLASHQTNGGWCTHAGTQRPRGPRSVLVPLHLSWCARRPWLTRRRGRLSVCLRACLSLRLFPAWISALDWQHSSTSVANRRTIFMCAF